MVEAAVSATILCRLRRLLALLVGLALPLTVCAHRLDEYLQATLVVIEPGGLRLQINLTPGVDVAEQVLTLVDRDGDGVISPKEAAAYAETLERDLIVRVDGRDVGLKLIGSNFFAPAELRTGSGIIQMEFSVTATPLAAGAHRFALENRHLPAVSEYLFNAAKPRVNSVQITTQRRNENQSTGEIEFVLRPPSSP